MNPAKLTFKNDRGEYEKDLYVIDSNGKPRPVESAWGELIVEAIKETLDKGAYDQQIGTGVARSGDIILTEPGLDAVDFEKISLVRAEAVGLTTNKVLLLIELSGK